MVNPTRYGQFQPSPYNISPKRLCEFINTEYRELVMPYAKNTTDLPYSDDKNQDICELVEKVWKIIIKDDIHN